MLNALLALPAFLLSLCLVVMAMDADAYVRHRDSGDQVGFAMGEFFLVSYLIPLAAATLVGVMHWWSRRDKAGKLVRPWWVWIGFFALSGIFVLFFVLVTAAWIVQASREYLGVTQFEAAALLGTASWVCVRAAFASLLVGVAWEMARGSASLASRVVRGSAWSILASLFLYVALNVGGAYRHATEPNVGGEPLTAAGGMLLGHAPTLFMMGILLWALWPRPKLTLDPTLETTSPPG